MQVSNQAEHTVRSNDSADSHVSNTKTNKETRDPQAVQFELSLLTTLHVRSYVTTFAHGTDRKVYKDHYSFNVFRIDLIRIICLLRSYCCLLCNNAQPFSGIMANVSLGGRLFYSSSVSSHDATRVKTRQCLSKKIILNKYARTLSSSDSLTATDME